MGCSVKQAKAWLRFPRGTSHIAHLVNDGPPPHIPTPDDLQNVGIWTLTLFPSQQEDDPCCRLKGNRRKPEREKRANCGSDFVDLSKFKICVGSQKAP